MRIRRLTSMLALGALSVGCGEQPAAPDAPRISATAATLNVAAKPRGSSATVHWNAIARDLVVQHQSNPFVANRAYAIMTTAQYNAVIAAENTHGRHHPSSRAAVIGASVVALSYVFPTDATSLEQLAMTDLSSPPRPGDKHEDITAGETIGRAIANGVVARATNDRFFAPWPGTVPVGPGLWFSTANPPAPPVGPMFGLARTYFLSSGDQFRPPPPPTFGSATYLAALHEVRQISDTRTAEQTASAVFWALGAGTATPPGYWNAQGADLATRHHLNERDAAHALALVNMAGFDAIVACHDAKFTYWLIRPTQADPLITLAVALPNFPSYPSDHACLSGAQSKILGAIFPAERKSLDSLAEQAALSRLYAGLHYRFDNETGLRLGRTVAALALSNDVHGHKPFVLK